MLSPTALIGRGVMGSSCANRQTEPKKSSHRKSNRCLFDCNALNPIFVTIWLGSGRSNLHIFFIPLPAPYDKFNQGRAFEILEVLCT
jgi:hypothetical protein